MGWVRRTAGSAALTGILLILVLALSACDKRSSSGSGSPPPVALPTYSANEFTGNRVCAGVGLARVEISFKAGIPEGYVVDGQGNHLRGPLLLIWPPGYQLQPGQPGAVILSPDNAITIRDGDVLLEPSICLMADGRQLVWDTGQMSRP